MAGLTKPGWHRLSLAGFGPARAGSGLGWVPILSLDGYATTMPPFKGHRYAEPFQQRPRFYHPITLCAALVTAVNALKRRSLFYWKVFVILTTICSKLVTFAEKSGPKCRRSAVGLLVAKQTTLSRGSRHGPVMRPGSARG